jgi:hypothetical protein
MPTKKFLELDSNYRNRNMFPNPGQFEVSISQSGLKGQAGALDPLTYAYPEITFSPFDFINFQLNPDAPSDPKGLLLTYSPASGDTQTTFLLGASSSTVLILYADFSARNYVEQDETEINQGGNGYLFPTTNGYCVGLSLMINGGAGANFQTRRIVGWQYLQDDMSAGTQYQVFQCTIESPYEIANDGTAIPLNTSQMIIYNPSDLHTDPVNSYLFIPQTMGVPELYCKYILYNITKNNYCQITRFDMDTHLAKVDVSAFTGTAGQWELSDRYVMRKEVPRFYGSTPDPDQTDPITSPFIIEPNNIINFGSDWTWDASYINNFMAIYYTPESDLADINKPTAVAPLILQITGFIFAPPVDPEEQFPPAAPIYTSRAYFKTLPNVNIYSLIANRRFPPGTYFEILNFNIDNVSPFVFTGTMSAQSQAVAQEVGLNSLILPNVTLKSGGRIAYYPYIFVEIENTSSSSSGTKNLIYSNNPFTYKAVFKVPITDLNHPSQSPFVKLTGNGMTQTMIFKQNDDMRVSIRLPNGDLFEPFSTDNLFGNSPNPRLQISAVFSMEKIS